MYVFVEPAAHLTGGTVREPCVFVCELFRSAVLDLNPKVSSGHITKTNRVWQQAGCLYSYEGLVNLMSMNNE